MKKKEYKIRLVNSILGWQLIPVNDESYDALDKFYGAKYTKLKPSERAVLTSDPIKFVKRVAKYDGVSLSFCGSKARPTIRMWIKQT